MPLIKVTQDLSLICICKQKNFSPVSSINLSQTDKALPLKISKPNLVTFFVYFGNILFDYLWNFFVCYCNQPGSLGEFGAARSEELEVNQWIDYQIFLGVWFRSRRYASR